MSTTERTEVVRTLSREYPDISVVQIAGYLDDAMRTIIRNCGKSDLVAAENLTRLRFDVHLRAGRA